MLRPILLFTIILTKSLPSILTLSTLFHYPSCLVHRQSKNGSLASKGSLRLWWEEEDSKLILCLQLLRIDLSLLSQSVRKYHNLAVVQLQL